MTRTTTCVSTTQRSGRSRRPLALLLCCLPLLAPPAHTEVVNWLYQVVVPVADQSAAARTEAAGQALVEVLMRISGRATLPADEALERAMGSADRYYSQFRYVSLEDESAPMGLRFDFAPGAAIDLAKQLGLPVWWANRPRIVPWILLQGRVLTEDDAAPLGRALVDRARRRGVPVVLPIADESGVAPVPPSAVTTPFSSVLLAAGMTLDAEVTGVGTVETGAGGVQSEWRFDVEGGEIGFRSSAADLASLGAIVADRLADQLAARFAASGGGAALEVLLRGATTPTQYAAVLAYLDGLEFIDQVEVQRVSGAGIELLIGSQAGPDRFLELLQIDGQLQAATPGADSVIGGQLTLDYRGSRPQ